MFKTTLCSLVSVLLITSAVLAETTCQKAAPSESRLAKILKSFKDADDGKVLVVAHRGDRKFHPENSIPAIVSAMDKGVDIVEIDVHLTSDGHLVLMHDSTIDRTTDGSGKVNEMTLKEIKKYHLKNPDGSISEETIPTAKEALETVRGKCMINIDKSELCLEECIALAKEMDMEEQIILKGNQNIEKIEKILGKADTKVFYGPIIMGRNDKEKKTEAAKFKENIKALHPEMIEVVFYDEGSWLLSDEAQELSDKHDIRLWCNSLFEKHGAGHVDAKALQDPDGNWGWIVEQGMDIIQTDEIDALMKYLRSKGLHD